MKSLLLKCTLGIVSLHALFGATSMKVFMENAIEKATTMETEEKIRSLTGEEQKTKQQQKKQLPSNMKCTSLDDDFDELLQANQQVYLFMAAKSAGSSLKEFVNQCMEDPQSKHHRDNFINEEERLKPFLLSSLQPPKVVANHLLNSSQPMMDQIRYGSRQSLIVYVYREETDRLMSAIKYVVKSRLCSNNHFMYRKSFGSTPKSVFGLAKDQESCSFHEKPLVDELIEKKIEELRYSVPAHLTCDLWDEINETGPNIVFVNYKQVDALQAKIASRYCPNIEPQQANVDNISSGSSSMRYQVRLQEDISGESVVMLEDWLEAKKHTLESFLKLSGGSCKAKTRILEDSLLACPSQAIQVFPNHV